MANSLPSPPQSLVLYSDPIYTGEQLDLTKKSESHSNRVDRGDNSFNRIEDVLQAMLPPQMWHEESGYWLRYVSPCPSTRLDVIKLQEEIDTTLSKRQAKDCGICPVREDIYAQCFDELIRQVTINSPEQGLLLLRIRDELRLTIDAYKMLFESSILFGIRKQLQAEEGTGDIQEKLNDLAKEKHDSECKLMSLSNKLELIEKRAGERKAMQDKKNKEEVDFLKYQNQHLEAFLKAAGSGGVASLKK
uniref:Dynein light chain intermediate polypeptide putative n=1 Tax=Albugo laibachii Nc14 TaxID=890382 RepID=F0W747_9STRA|nr:dynein light chain intermediate polypeptide putative [Albugo laibachii Nc14]|eukprot:CCA16946.1 dynein light chain intermediate polypeptide putative [Albugo laibachii Nc14]